MEIDEYYTLRHYIGPPDRHPAHRWRKVSIVLRFAIRLSLLYHKQRDRYRRSSSSSAGFMEFDPFIHYPEIDPFIHHPEFDIYRGWAAHLWRKVSIVLRFAIRLSLLYHKQRDQYRPSSSSSAGFMEFDPFIPFLHDPEFDIYRGRPAHLWRRPAHLWRKISIVLRFAIRLSLLHHKQRNQHRSSSSSSAGLMEFDPLVHYPEINPFIPFLHDPEFDIYRCRPAHLWRKVNIVLRFAIRLSLKKFADHHQQRDQYRPSSSSSSSSSALRSRGKVAYICVWTIDKYEWYAFDVSDDIKHNQTPPAKYIDYLIPFHEDDESGMVNLKPQVTAKMDWILGWEILGFKTLYILDDWKGPSASGESNRVDCIDVSRIRFFPWEWEPVQTMPNQITASAHTCVLGGKFYCLGGRHPSQKVELVGKSRLAMPYSPSLKAATSPPPPPCLNLDKILSAFKEVPKPYLTSQNLELEGQLPNSESERYVHKQLSSAIEMAITKRYLWEITIYKQDLPKNYSPVFGYMFYVQRKYYIEKIFYHKYVRQKYFHKKLISSIKYAQPCSLSLNSPVTDYFLKAVSLVEEFFRPSVEEYQQILKTSVVFLKPSVEQFHKPLLLKKFLKLSVEKFLKPRFPSVEEFFKPRFPSQNMQLERQSPWVMAYDMRQKKWESLLDPPYRPIKIDNIFTAAREFSDQCLVVGLPEDCLLQIYHVNTQQWEIQEFKICPKFGPKVLTGPALSVDSKLYWYSVDDHCLVGYDLVTKMWFVGNFPIHDHGERFGVRDVDTPPRLAHLGGDNFCLLWVSVLQHKSMKSSESKDNCISHLHCMKLRVTTGNLHPSGIISLEVSILSCQSYLASGLKFFRGGLVVDGHSRYSGV